MCVSILLLFTSRSFASSQVLIIRRFVFGRVRHVILASTPVWLYCVGVLYTIGELSLYSLFKRKKRAEEPMRNEVLHMRQDCPLQRLRCLLALYSCPLAFSFCLLHVIVFIPLFLLRST